MWQNASWVEKVKISLVTDGVFVIKEKSIGKKLVRALAHSLGGRYAVYGVQLVSMMVLARLFTPEQFGFFAVIQVFSIFFVLFSEMGLGPALINEKKIGAKMRDGVFSLTWIIGAGLGLLFWLAAPAISWFYENSLYSLLVIPVAISVTFNTALIVPLASLTKDQLFFSIARCDVFAELGSLALVLGLIGVIDPIWALACKPLAVALIKALLLWLASAGTITGRAGMSRDFDQVKPLLSFATYQLGFNILNYFSRNLDNILVGKYFGVISLGVYDKAYQLMRYPLMLLTFAMGPAIQPVLTEIKHDRHEFERLHNKFVKYMSLLGLVVGVAVYLLSELIVQILLGSQWAAVTPLLQILSITIPIQIVLSSSGGFFQAAGRADLLFKCGIFSSITNITAIAMGIWLGNLEILCWAILCSFSLNFFQCYYTLGKNLLPSGFLGVFKNMIVAIVGVAVFSFLVLAS
ncbi:MAG: lipopolysaccharide biosynthesis protein [Colwellia sp.]